MCAGHVQVAGGGARGGRDEAGEGELKKGEVEAAVENAALRLWVGEWYLGALSVLCLSFYITDWSLSPAYRLNKPMDKEWWAQK